MTRPQFRGVRPALLASVSVLLCLAALALLGSSLENARPPSSGGAAASPTPPATEASASDPERAAWLVARRIASATDAGDPTPDVSSCEKALDEPNDRRCADYEDALRDFLDVAREACDEPGHVRAEDFSCVPESFFGGPCA